MKKEDFKNLTKDDIVNIFVDFVNEMEKSGEQYKENYKKTNISEMLAISNILLTKVNYMNNVIKMKNFNYISYGRDMLIEKEAYLKAIEEFKQKHNGNIPISFEDVQIGKAEFLDDKLEKLKVEINSKDKKYMEDILNQQIGISSIKQDSYIYVSIYNEDSFKGLQVPIKMENIIRHLNNNSTNIIDCIFDNYDDFKSYELDCSQYAREKSNGIKKINNIEELKNYFSYNKTAIKLLEKF